MMGRLMMSRGTISQSTQKLSDGRQVRVYTLTNRRGVQTRITNFGGNVLSLSVPDRRGKMGDVVLGFNEVSRYQKDSPYFGALIGRYGNRIARGRFTLDGQTYSLPINNTPNSLHGGTVGFDKRIWNSHAIRSRNSVGVELRLFSPSGDQGYPSNLNTRVTYELTDSNELRIQYFATADKATPFNPTHHSYFNLKGAGQGNILNHIVTLNASRFTPVDKTLIPTGQLQSVKGTPFDFTRPHAIGERIGANNQQLKFGAGYDHNFVVNGSRGVLRRAARVVEPTTGRIMDVYTTEKGIQLYTGNFLDGKLRGKGGKTYVYRGGFCLEAQNFPDAPNKPNFPNSILRPGRTYRQTTVYRFSAQ